MSIPLEQKSSPETIRKRFDKDVERFSDLATGQVSVVDAALQMDLITQAALRGTKSIHRILDIGCGAGNNALKLIMDLGSAQCDLVDLSLPMLEKARERISALDKGQVRVFHGDFRTLELPEQTYDIILAAAVFHHLRDDDDWEHAFAKLYRLTASGGGVWITDLVSHETEAIQSLMWQRYGEYLDSVAGDAFRKVVFDYIEKEDSPRPITYQLDLLCRVGFGHVELLHKNSCFASFGAIKDAEPGNRTNQ
jgi:tRNA (cmo5U34)-methyltransferase